MNQRPEYAEIDGIISVETWQEACAISQQWADGARLAALKRKRFRRWLGLMLMLVFIALLTALVLFLTGVLKP